MGRIEVTARLVEIPDGAIFKRELYDYATVLKYEVLKVHRGQLDTDTIYVGHYNPFKPRSEAADKPVKGIGGNLRTFRVGQIHRMALEVPIDDYFIIANCSRRHRQSLMMSVSVIVNLGLLGFFKYAAFLQNNLNHVLRLLGAGTALANVVGQAADSVFAAEAPGTLDAWSRHSARFCIFSFRGVSMFGNRRKQLFLPVAFATAICSASLSQAIIELLAGQRPQVTEMLTQIPTKSNLRAFERELQDNCWLAKQLRPWMQYAQFIVLRELGDKAVVGGTRWLFYKPAVQYLIEPWSPKQDPDQGDIFSAIISFRDQLAGRGIKLLLVPTPNKASVYPDMLTRQARWTENPIDSKTSDDKTAWGHPQDDSGTTNRKAIRTGADRLHAGSQYRHQSALPGRSWL